MCLGYISILQCWIWITFHTIVAHDARVYLLTQTKVISPSKGHSAHIVKNMCLGHDCDVGSGLFMHNIVVNYPMVCHDLEPSSFPKFASFSTNPLFVWFCSCSLWHFVNIHVWRCYFLLSCPYNMSFYAQFDIKYINKQIPSSTTTPRLFSQKNAR